ncbi:hypothetical protein AWI07_24290 [Enterobacter roggenkampii]|nr:hypothetical protein AWI07_24290 [Enterobacter roggenkampii]
MMSLWDALRMNMMISYQELVRTFLSENDTTVSWDPSTGCQENPLCVPLFKPLHMSKYRFVDFFEWFYIRLK